MNDKKLTLNEGRIMKKAIVTILGIQNAKWTDDGLPIVNDYNHKARYYFENENNIKSYYSTFPLIIEKYGSEFEIVPIYTQDAKHFNIDLLKYEKQDFIFHDEISLIKENEYFEIFKKIDHLVDVYNEVIVDLTHGFRHIPILVILDLVIQNFKKTDKINKILFAKEIVKHTQKDEGEYEIVDLKEYLDIANISFVLSSFENNYTISNHIKTSDKDFQELINMLSNFSEHIMANSLIKLFKGNNSLVEKIYKAIESIKVVEKTSPILSKLEIIQEHLRLFIALKEKREDEQLFELAKLVKEKGYYLNAITLLDEAIGWYCAYSLCHYNEDFKKEFKHYKHSDSYKITAEAKNIIKFTFDDREYANKLKIKDIKSLQKQIERIDGCKQFNKILVDATSKDRNNLAHANNEKVLDDVKKRLEKLLVEFNKYCIQDDVLKKKETTLADLQNVFKANHKS